jgi:hypothetical protein
MEEARISKLSHALFWIATLEAIVISVVCIVGVMGWIPTSIGGRAEKIVITPPLGSPATALTGAQTRERAR